jgi:hypothetical protein
MFRKGYEWGYVGFLLLLVTMFTFV